MSTALCKTNSTFCEFCEQYKQMRCSFTEECVYVYVKAMSSQLCSGQNRYHILSYNFLHILTETVRIPGVLVM